MTKIIIADHHKSSLVMTAEVFKDKLPGVVIDISGTGAGLLDRLETKHTYDMIVLDFDLPDVDAVSLSKYIRPLHHGPILITAYPEEIVSKAIEDELFAYHDSTSWVPKPIRFEELSKRIDMFLLKKKRVIKRFDTKITATIVGKSQGRGKKTPKFQGATKNLSLGGALFSAPKGTTIPYKQGDHITVLLQWDNHSPTRIEGNIVWQDRKKNLTGIAFQSLNEEQTELFHEVFRGQKEITI